MKFYAWEDSFKKTIQDARDDELVMLRKFSFLRAAVIAMIGVTPTLIAMISFLSLASNNPLNPALVLTL